MKTAKAPTKRSYQDPAFERVEKNLDHVLDWIAEERSYPSRELSWNFVCMYAFAKSWHPFEFIIDWTRRSSFHEQLCQLVAY